MERINFIMMVGLPGSGKSTAAKHYAKSYNANIHSSDDIREEIFGDANDQEHNKEVFEILHKRIKEDIENGKACIYDATNISYERRLAFLQEIRGAAKRRDINLTAICIFVCTPIEFCYEWNKQRERKVPDKVIDKMYKKFDVPYFYEGWDDIQVFYPIRGFRDYYGSVDDFIVTHLGYDQQNKHHSLTLGAHLEAARTLVDGYKSFTEEVVGHAAALHDCGKPYCATFKNYKGEISEDCHYYGHERVGAYMCIFFKSEFLGYFGRLEAAAIIRWHMQPYFMSKEAFEKKYTPKLGEKLIEQVLQLHQADIAAH